MALTDTACKNAKCPAGKARERYTDSGGLYLELQPTGAKHWRWKYRYAGKEKRLAIGIYPSVTLAQARKARDEAPLPDITKAHFVALRDAMLKRVKPATVQARFNLLRATFTVCIEDGKMH